MLPALIGFAALTIDVGAMYSVRNDLQISADAAALAAASAYAGDEMIQIQGNIDPLKRREQQLLNAGGKLKASSTE